MEKALSKLSAWLLAVQWEPLLEKIPKQLVIFLILALGFASFNLNDNEEQYLQLAKQFADPTWIPNSSNFSEFPGTRFLYQSIMGFFLSYFSFEVVTFTFRLLLCGLYALVISNLYRLLQLRNIQILFHLAVLFLLHQSLFAGSWMMVSVEPKGFAYVFVLLALYYYSTGRYLWMTLLLLLTTYIHILVGGYAFVYLFACVILFVPEVRLWKKVAFGIGYAILLIPFILYLRSSIQLPIEGSVDPNWVYTYYRTPHHTALFYSVNYFYNVHFYGVFLTGIAFLFCLGSYHLVRTDRPAALLTIFAGLALLGTLCLVPLALVDKTGAFLKYYPYRINSLATFILGMLLAYWLYRLIKPEYLKLANFSVLIISLFFLFKIGFPNIAQNTYLRSLGVPLNEVSDFILKNTDQGDIILTFGKELSLTRKTRRDVFVMDKYIPAELSRVPDWYQRMEDLKKLKSDLRFLDTMVKKYRIDYLLSERPLQSDLLSLVYSNDRYYLYELSGS